MHPDEFLPLDRLLDPVLVDARDRLQSAFDQAAVRYVTAEGMAGWERYLLVRLTKASAQVASWQFDIFTTVRSTFSTSGKSARAGRPVLYDQFVGSDPRQRLRCLHEAFPAFEKLCAVLVRNWISTVSEFVSRLAVDHEGLKSRFPAARIAGPVTKVEAGLSDPHRGGRCVAKVTFQSGAALFYKPRSLGTEAAFSRLVQWLNASGLPFPLRAADTWDRDVYGWMEEIERADCSSGEQIEDFYWRTGALLGLIHLARGIDFHCENLVAAGEQPVLVDLETLLHPRIPGEEHPAVPPWSLLRTGFLPQSNPLLARYEWGALSRDLKASEALSAQNRHNLPVLDGKAESATDHVPPIERGYTWIGQSLLCKRSLRRQFEEWLRDLAARERRLIRRITRRYTSCLERLTEPEHLRSQLEAIPVNVLLTGDSPVIEDEVEAIKQMDVPYLLQGKGETCRVERSDLELPTLDSYLSRLPEISAALGGEGRP